MSTHYYILTVQFLLRIKRLFKKFSINIKSGDKISRFKVKGNLNILNKKINFEQISFNEKKFLKEDLKYFKNSFEKICLIKDSRNI